VLTTFAGATLDRAAERRADAAWVAERRAEPAARAVAVVPDGVVLEGDRLARLPLAELDGAEPLLLGLEAGHALFAVDTPSPPAGAGEVIGLRDAAARLSQAEGGLAAYAAALANWHRAHPRCARCGAPTDVAEAGFLRLCPSCGAHHHPRTDPVVIMLVIDQDRDRVVLGRQPTWPAGRYSALAGFVEPGESLEEAVSREVMEEAGVTVRDARYVASQPWPFPSSLMLGFMAEHAAGEPEARDGELDDARWFTRAELQDAVDGHGTLGVPPPLAIARRLIDAWLRRSP
jgi:NAD+ diphosphatase